jgi:hypothetical protein
MKAKLPLSSNHSTKRTFKCHGIFTFLIILFMTVSSFGQEVLNGQYGIVFELCGATITFDAPTITPGQPYEYPIGTAVIGDVNQQNWELVYENAGTPTISWALKGPTDQLGTGARSIYYFIYESSTCSNSIYPSDDLNSGCWTQQISCGGLTSITYKANPCNTTTTTYYADMDMDGFGDANNSTNSCTGNPPAGFVTDNTDCNDSEAAIFPGNPEVCDGLDNNCDGTVDEGFTKTTYYVDADGDTFGSMDDVGEEFCTDPGAGYSSNNDDCDDTNASITTCIVYQYCNEEETKVVICHKGKDICVSMNAIDAHLAHGDSLGSCSSKAGNGKGGIEESVEETPTSYDVAFWPNPSNSNFNVKMITPNVTEKVSIEAFDMNGRLVHTNKINGNQNYQFGNNLSTGIYIVKLTQVNTVKMFKVVKQ